MFPPDFPMEKVISLIVQVEDGIVSEVLHVARTNTRTHIEGAKRTNLKASLRSKEGEILAQANLLRLERLPSGCGDIEGGEEKSYIAQAFIPDVATGAALEISSEKEILWRREATEKPCKIREFKAKVVKPPRQNREVLQVGWKITNKPEDIWVRWSIDGENWKSLATSLTGEKASFDARMLPSGKVMIQLAVHDGFFSTYSEPVNLELRKYPPEVSILHPVDGHTYVEGQTLRLWGVATGNEPVRKATWYIGRKKIAQGLDAWVTLKPGKHVLTLQVEDEGGREKAEVKIVVSKSPKDQG